MSDQLQSFLTQKGVATSRMTLYNPRGNSPVKRFNGILWKAITLALKSLDLPITQREQVVADALHSIRSLFFTATNADMSDFIHTIENLHPEHLCPTGS